MKNKNILISILKSLAVLLIPASMIILSSAVGTFGFILLGMGIITLAGVVISMPDIISHNVCNENIKEISKKELETFEEHDITIKKISLEKKQEKVLQNKLSCNNLIEYFDSLDEGMGENISYTRKLTR